MYPPFRTFRPLCAALSTSGGRRPANVLLAEDDPVVGRLLVTVMKSFGCDAELATDGEHAWQRFETGRFRVVISDWMMPRIDGLELCRRIRTRATPGAYFILLTGGGIESDRALAKAAGVDDYLNKPLNRRDLLDRLQVAFRSVETTTKVG